jgi:SAM-dependent methyltransferase
LSAEKDPNKRWAAEYDSGKIQAWPSENLVRMMQGSYIPELEKDYEGKKVLDIGCGSGNNLFFLGSLGMKLYGTEVDSAIVSQTRDSISVNRFESTNIEVGFNRSLPFPSNEFDYLVSWNVIHYEQSDEHMHEAIDEYRRVLKPGGRFFISTTGPDDMILKGAQPIGNHIYRIGLENDLRHGDLYYCFGTASDIEVFFSAAFQDVRVGRARNDLFSQTLDWFLVTGVKGDI